MVIRMVLRLHLPQEVRSSEVMELFCSLATSTYTNHYSMMKLTSSLTSKTTKWCRFFQMDTDMAKVTNVIQ